MGGNVKEGQTKGKWHREGKSTVEHAQKQGKPQGEQMGKNGDTPLISQEIQLKRKGKRIPN